MIDKKHQGKGYGKEAMQLALDFIRAFPCGAVEYRRLSYAPQNSVAKKLYKSLGFAERPDYYVEGEKMPAVLKL